MRERLIPFESTAELPKSGDRLLWDNGAIQLVYEVMRVEDDLPFGRVVEWRKGLSKDDTDGQESELVWQEDILYKWKLIIPDLNRCAECDAECPADDYLCGGCRER